MKDTLKEILSKRKYEFIGIFLIAMAFFNWISFSSKDTGLIGNLFNRGLRYIIGKGIYGFPLLLILLGITMIYRSKAKIRFTSRTIGIIIILLVVQTLLHIQVEHPLEFEAALEGKGGGLIGGVILYIFRKCFAEYGTYVILAALTLIGVLLISDIFLVNILLKVKSLYKSFIGFFAKNKDKAQAKAQKKAKKEAARKAKEQQKAKKREAAKNKDKSNKDKFSLKKVFSFLKFKKKKKAKEEKENNGIKDKSIKEDIVIQHKSTDKVINQPEVFKQKAKVKEEVKDKAAEELKAATKEVAATVGAKKEDSSKEQVVIDENKQARKRINKKLESNNQQEQNLDSAAYSLPPLDLLNEVDNSAVQFNNKADILQETLDSFGVRAQIKNVSYGPTITRYELQPAPGVKVSKILGLADDIALSLAAPDVRIEAPIPGKAAIGIEIPNESKAMVSIREMLESEEFQNAESKLTMALGKDISGRTLVADLGDMPHMLVAGSTGSGKSVFVNCVINSILYKSTPDEVKFMLIDPKMVEFAAYQQIPHLVAPVINDSKKAATALRWVVQEMENRYELFAGSGARGLDSYNRKISLEGSDPLPYVVVIIDELADLMMVAAKEVEEAICRLAQKARAAGIHLILATQRPSVDVITGLIKANIPTRVSFSLSSQADSRTILDTGGAEKLLGKGDMLFSPVGSNQPKRLQGAFISDKELQQVVNFVREQKRPEYAEKIAKIKEKNVEIQLDDERDELYEKAVELVVKHRASISMLQRKLRIGYNRAARMIDRMEKDNIVGEYQGSKAREVLVEEEDLEEILNKN
ncbi:DNA translocase FtsK [Orenia metallireducens]|jgi:S-DNA-T family DNA segregation ATPase FtsK/SpoIIIE|uniref:DNA translocase FtsK n=1 Tax=Orenia metallireducens TaxID=1413210 RepID=A0A285FJI3_9FIRM|nr:DNA translocase FtsK [Orenia metallireducens]PRX33577.1 DNA translocase FtsK [Orenia metallireducens]SNY11243.1 DNA translocase FtsK [Orenia metallireducens]